MKRGNARPDVPARIAAVALLALLAWEASGADLPLSHLFGGPRGFAFRSAWVTQHLLHDGGRWLAAAVLVLMIWDTWRPLVPGPTRRERGYWLGVVVLSLLLVPTLKRFSSTSCPWDLAEFGGRSAYVPHWLLGLADGGPGHCFPSGHAVASFAFFGLYFLWQPHRPTVARWALIGVLTAGAAFAWAQLARGAHFASHSFWSAWVCWTVASLAAPLAPDRVAGQPARR